MIEVDFDEVTESIEEQLAEAFSSKSKMSVVKGRTGIRYVVVYTDVTDGLSEELWYNLDPIDGDAFAPRLRFFVRVLPAGKFYAYKDEKFGAMERPKMKSDDWWRRTTSRDIEWMNKQLRDWLSSSAGKAFVEKNGLEGCLCIKNFLEASAGRRAR